MGMDRLRAWDDLAKPDPQERWHALVLIVTRKHQSAWPRAFLHTSKPPRTGDAVEARVAFCEIKGFTEQKATLASAVAPAPVP